MNATAHHECLRLDVLNPLFFGASAKPRTRTDCAIPVSTDHHVPFAIAVVEVEGTRFKILARVDDAKYEDLKIGMAVELKVHKLADGRVFYRYRPAAQI